MKGATDIRKLAKETSEAYTAFYQFVNEANLAGINEALRQAKEHDGEGAASDLMYISAAEGLTGYVKTLNRGLSEIGMPGSVSEYFSGLENKCVDLLQQIKAERGYNSIDKTGTGGGAK